jgi:signal transduction histidine kinase
LDISDEGTGVPAEKIGRIFEPFFSTKSPGEGTGLGLAVVHGVIVSHEGACVVTSVPDKGTTFSVYFPLP